MKRKRKLRMVSIHVLVPHSDYLLLMGIRDNVGVSMGTSIRQAIRKWLEEEYHDFSGKEDDITREKRTGTVTE